MTARLALDGATPLLEGSWPDWPPPATDEQRDLLLTVLDSGDWGSTSGQLCATFATRFAARHGCSVGVTNANGTLGLTAALVALGVGPGDEVVVPGYTFVACATSVAMLGAVPVIADVDPRDGHLTAATIEPALSERTRAIMVVHLAGSPCSMDGINALAAARGLPVIEDAAQSHGASYLGRPVGSLGQVASFSFQASKAMTAGEGGILVTDDEELGDVLWSVCNVGRSRHGAWYGHERIGWNLRMTEFQAAVLLPWLDRLDAEVDARNAFCDALATGLAERGGHARLAPAPSGTTRDSRHLGMVDLDPYDEGVDKQFCLDALAAEGIPRDAGYPGLAGIPAVAAVSRCLPQAGTDRFASAIVWLRQHVLMADPSLADATAAAITRVVRDPRARRVP